MALGGDKIGLVHIPKEKSPVQIVMRLPQAERTGLEHFGEIAVRRPTGEMVQLSELLRLEQTIGKPFTTSTEACGLCRRRCRRPGEKGESRVRGARYLRWLAAYRPLKAMRSNSSREAPRSESRLR
jgi:hypothetical protein